MRILFDHNVPAPLARCLTGHEIGVAKRLGWDRMVNGHLLDAAEKAGFELLMTADKNMYYQQDFRDRQIALIVIGNPSWPILRNHLDLVVEAIHASGPGTFLEVEIPYPAKPGGE